MLRSLVGSEMCIRDRLITEAIVNDAPPLAVEAPVEGAAAAVSGISTSQALVTSDTPAVSYHSHTAATRKVAPAIVSPGRMSSAV